MKVLTGSTSAISGVAGILLRFGLSMCLGVAASAHSPLPVPGNGDFLTIVYHRLEEGKVTYRIELNSQSASMETCVDPFLSGDELSKLGLSSLQLRRTAECPRKAAADVIRFAALALKETAGRDLDHPGPALVVNLGGTRVVGRLGDGGAYQRLRASLEPVLDRRFPQVVFERISEAENKLIREERSARINKR